MPDALVTARALRKTYLSGDRRIEVLNGVDLAITPGESVSIRGESGSGKSTLLQLLAGLDGADSGEILWRGEKTLAAARRARLVGMVFQAFYLVPELDALANVLLARRIIGRLDAAAHARAKELLRRVGLAERAHHLPSQLSGGERQRVAVARALMNQPPLILADEPTGNLDTANGEEVMQLLTQLNTEGTTIVMVTHSHSHAQYAHRVVNLLDGAIVTESIRKVL